MTGVQTCALPISVKGAASNIGANKLWKTFRELEEAAKQKNLNHVNDLFKRASLEFVELQEYIVQLKSQLAALT